MTYTGQPVSSQVLFWVGVDALPWIGFAAALFFVPMPVGQSVLPWPNVSAPLLILLGGALIIVSRWRGSPTSESVLSEDTALPLAVPGSPRSAPHLLARLPGREELLRRISRAVRASEEGRAAGGKKQLDRQTEDAGPSLLTIRVDEHPDVTDSFGHEASQDLLAAAARRVEETLPPGSTAARIAEDTFAALLPNTGAEDAWEVGEDLAESLGRPFAIVGQEVPIRVSIGLSTYRPSDSAVEDAEELLQASYSAMHQVGRQEGRVLGAHEDGRKTDSRRLQRRERLREAIAEGELVLYYQPVVHLLTGDTVGAEALVRWDHPEHGLLSPADFIPLAEETGLIGNLDRWVFEQALRRAEAWTTGAESPLDWVSVNMSPGSVEGDLQEWCLERLRGASVPDGGLHLEITERWALGGEQPLQPLREAGIRLSIDDFGTGYSSLRYLRSLNADVLKIDREFIEDLGQDDQTTAIVQFLLNLSLRLDVEVIAEGVETAEQETVLRDFGCAMAQGYHFSRPVPAERLLQRTGSTSGDAEAPA